MLRQQGDRVVLGPAADGGYYLIGLRHPHAHLFTNIAWGSDTVAESTRSGPPRSIWQSTELPEWYDIDDAETLGWLRAELAGGAERFRRGADAHGDKSVFCQVGRNRTDDAGAKRSRGVYRSSRSGQR